MRDQVVINLGPINPLLLQPGDFYLQAAPFCEQSARIVVCSLLDQEGRGAKVIEETPVPETSYSCIFSREWLEEINQGRHGTPLSQCLLATERGVVKLPWERVAVPDFVDVPQCAGNSMASAPSSCPFLPPPHPHTSLLPHFPNRSSSNCSFSLSKEAAPKQHPVAIQNSVLTSSSHPSSFSVETRICPAKHGIAVSLRLVDTSAASSSRLVKVKETEPEPKPIGWVSPSMWDSRFTGIVSNTTKTSTVSGECIPTSTENNVTDFQNIGQANPKDTQLREASRSGPTGEAAAEGEYIDILQASMLFGRAQSVTEAKEKFEVPPCTQMQKYTYGPVKMQRHPQTESHWQTQSQPNTENLSEPHSQAHMHLTTKPQSQSDACVSLRGSESAETGPPSALQHSQSHHPHPDSFETSPCIRTVRFSEKPCTPCMRRRQVRNVSRAQELRCRYRESYQAAIQNPVTFGQENMRGKMLAVVEEDGDFSQCGDRQRPPGTDTDEARCNVLGMWFDPGIRNQHPPSVSGSICEESGEQNTVPYWRAGLSKTAPCVEYRGTYALKCGPPEPTAGGPVVPIRDPGDAHSAKPYISNVNGTDSAVGMRINTLSSVDPKLSNMVKHHGLQFPSSEVSGMKVKTPEGLHNRTSSTGMSSNVPTSLTAPQGRRDSMSDRRCSSLSTAVVDTSEKCELVIVEGQNVRRRENSVVCAEIPQLHVVKCKNSTAFGLVSPKINRRRVVNPGTELTCHMC